MVRSLLILMSQIFAQRNPLRSVADDVDGMRSTTDDPLWKTLKLRLDILPSLLILQ
jgi:hypothetical protein